MIPTRDWCSRAGAYDLADKITAYWAARGKRITVEVIQTGDGDKHGVWSIRSDLAVRAPVR